jgi:uncharacterized phage-associated protein
MVTAHDVAAYILGRQGPMSAMKLQKLVYYSQAWSLVWDSRPLFRECIQAWAHGPVVPELYHEHRGMFEVRGWPRGNAAALGNVERETVNAVLDYYGGPNAEVLSGWTHSEDPWRHARAGLPQGERGNAEITLESMREYYASLCAHGPSGGDEAGRARMAGRAGATRGSRMRELGTVLEKREELSPRQFLSLLERDTGDIERVSIRPPRLGERGFGRVVVERKRGVVRPSFGPAPRG